MRWGGGGGVSYITCLCVLALWSHVSAEHSLGSLPPGDVYYGANGNADADLCYCNTVAYSLFSACGACQGQEWVVYGHNVFLAFGDLSSYH